LRRFSFVAHVAFSVGWLGAVVAYLALAVVARGNPSEQLARAAYLAMELLGWYVIVPFSLAALVSGVVQSLGTTWGLFRYYWVAVKFGLTTVATVVLLLHMRNVSRMAGVAADATLSLADFGPLRQLLVVHAAGGLAVLLAATVLSVYKPWGRTALGQRQQRERRGLQGSSPAATTQSVVSSRQGKELNTQPWRQYIGYVAAGAGVLFLLLHLLSGGRHAH
jgi:ABC-type transport system involved in multi-copper enzyme maturation permease subunit